MRRGTPSLPTSNLVKFAELGADDGAPAQLLAKLVDPSSESKTKDSRYRSRSWTLWNRVAKITRKPALLLLIGPTCSSCKRNAQDCRIAERYSTIGGSAFDVDYGTGYDLILLTNFCTTSIHQRRSAVQKVHAALAEGGRAVTLEFVPNEDRISPPDAAAFSVMIWEVRRLEMLYIDRARTNVC